MNVTVINWPSSSLDLNFMENLWGILVRRVYEGGKQYVNVLELKAVILHQWSLLDIPLLHRLCTLLPSHLLEIASRQGAAIDY